MKTESKKKRGEERNLQKNMKPKEANFLKLKKIDLKDGENLWKENSQSPLTGVKANTQKYSLISTYTCRE